MTGEQKVDMNNQPPLEPQLMRANRQVIETSCLICRQGFQLAETVYACPFCHGFHHMTCWESQRQCPAGQSATNAAWAVGGQAPTAGPPAQAFPQTISYAAGVSPGLPPDDRYCPNCSQIIKRDALNCRFCGGALDSRFIPSGQSFAVASVPGLHWVAVLVLGMVTCGIFPPIWGIRQGVWAKKVDSASNATVFYSLYFVTAIIGVVLEEIPDLSVFGLILRLGSGVLFLCGSFSIKNTIESHCNHRSLSGVMTFFFGPIYHQYHFNEIAKNRSGNLSILT